MWKEMMSILMLGFTFGGAVLGQEEGEISLVDSPRELDSEYREIPMRDFTNPLYRLKYLDQAHGLNLDLPEIRRIGLDLEEQYRDLLSLANDHRRIRRLDQAAQYYLQALDILELQFEDIDMANDVRSILRARYEVVYRGVVEVFLMLNRGEDAYQALERSRAHGVLTRFIEREVIPVTMPPDLEERSRKIDARRQVNIRNRDRLDPNRQKVDYNSFLKSQEDSHHERELLYVEHRRRVYSAVEIERPRPLGLDQVRLILEGGTLMLTYMVGPDETYLFALSRDEEIVVRKIDVDESTFWEQTQRFFEQLRNSTVEKTAVSMVEMASWLYEKLLGGISEEIRESERLLVVPDGPLFYLPFGALIGSDGSYLVEKKPVHTVVSATVYDHLLKRRLLQNVERATEIVAFGDPVYSKGTVEAAAAVNVAMNRGYLNGGLPPLPSSRREVVEIGKLYKSARILLSEEASEENAKALDAGVGVVHIAAHGVADAILPLDSFVALSVADDAGRENGLLQAWEVYERIRLDADLVVLSACETGFGPERDGEGLLSLSRAFQVAGARTVVASLWSVADESTAELMIRFYKHLRGDDNRPGKPKDEALRAAQLEFLAGPVTFVDSKGQEVTRDFSSPYYWAAFQVIGDRK